MADICLPDVPEDFANCIRERVKPARDRELHVECIDAFWDWQDYLAPLGVNLSGLAILEHESDVNFSFRYVTRGDLKSYQGFEKWLAMEESKDKCFSSKGGSRSHVLSFGTLVGNINTVIFVWCMCTITANPVRTWTVRGTLAMSSYFASSSCTPLL